MICVTREIGENIARKRRTASLTQQQIADQLTSMTDRDISLHMVSAWERGLRDIPAAIIPAICAILHCSSFELYPHSKTVSDRDMQIISTVIAMSDDEKDDLYYLLHDWDGDRKALLKLDVIHAVLDKSMRAEPDRMIIDNYIDAVKAGDPNIDRRIRTNVGYVLEAYKKLYKK